jgi:hypothetical protein
MVGIFVCLCLASKKPSKGECFVPAGTDLGVKLLITYIFGFVMGKDRGPRRFIAAVCSSLPLKRKVDDDVGDDMAAGSTSAAIRTWMMMKTATSCGNIF